MCFSSKCKCRRFLFSMIQDKVFGHKKTTVLTLAVVAKFISGAFWLPRDCFISFIHYLLLSLLPFLLLPCLRARLQPFRPVSLSLSCDEGAQICKFKSNSKRAAHSNIRTGSHTRMQMWSTKKGPTRFISL